MPTLHWVGKGKVVNHHHEVLFRDYRYMMVFENNPIDGAERLADALKKIAQL